MSDPAPSLVLPPHISIHGSLQGDNHVAPSPLNQDFAASYTPAAVTLKPKLILVAHYRE